MIKLNTHISSLELQDAALDWAAETGAFDPETDDIDAIIDAYEAEHEPDYDYEAEYDDPGYGPLDTW